MTQHPAILYVDNDPKSRKVMKVFLSLRLGLPDITIWDDSSDFAIHLAQLMPRPDLIFLDLHTRPLNAVQMLEIVRQNPRFEDVPIVALTTRLEGEFLQGLRHCGFNGYLSKPLDLNHAPYFVQQLLKREPV